MLSEKSFDSNLQFKDFLNNPEVRILLEDLMTVIDKGFSIEDIEGNLLFGNNLTSYTNKDPIVIHDRIIGFVNGETKISLISRLLSYWFKEKLLVFIDELTQIPNRRYFNHYLQQEWNRSQRE